MIRGIIVYDSKSGNTQKIAETIALSTNFSAVRVDAASTDLRGYDILVVGTYNIRAHPSLQIIEYIRQVNPPKSFALFVTFGMPIWGQLSSFRCFKDLSTFLIAKNSQPLGEFMCPGFHAKYKTYQGRPCEKDFTNAKKFAGNLLRKVSKI